MNRPALLPAVLSTLVNNEPSIAYTSRQRIMASMTGWANRAGPIQRGPSAAFLRDIVEIAPGTDRANVAAYIDALQTALVASLMLPNGGDPSRCLSLFYNALQSHAWHP